MRVESAEPARQLLLLDTHVVLWSAFGEDRLGTKTASVLEIASRENCLAISAITPWEIGLLVSKKRIDLHQETISWVRSILSRPGVRLAPLDPEIAVRSTHLPFEMHADPADRILVATARHLGATFVTADAALLELSRQGHFTAMDAAI